MDKLVRRVTVVPRDGEHHKPKVVFESDDDYHDEDGGPPAFKGLERAVRHVLKAQVIAAQDAYQRHLDSTAKDDNSWLVDAPMNFIKSRRKALKEIRKAVPFGMPKMVFDDDNDDEEK
jgi:hypothetical protein